MNDLITLDHVDTERLLYAIDTSLKVYRRHQYWLWVRGGLQRFLPHGMLLCAFGDLTSANYRVEVFAEQEITASQLARLNDPVSGLLPKLIAEWHRTGRTPSVIESDEEKARRYPDSVYAALHELGVCGVAGHGTGDFSGKTGSYFAFLDVPESGMGGLKYMLEVFTPYLRMALCRMAENESGKASPLPTSQAVLTGRELEVLKLMHAGKTNHEIGHYLHISPLTVKNHVQKILRKLNASNRTAASAKAPDYLFSELMGAPSSSGDSF